MLRRRAAVLPIALLGGLRCGFGLQQQPLTRPQQLKVTWDPEGETLHAYGASRQKESRDSTLSFSNGTGSCLTFLHIPKTGGTFVEATASKSGSGKSHLEPWGVHDKSLTCRGFGAKCPYKGQPKRCCPMKDGSTCSVWHVPPSVDDKLDMSYRQGGCETFCVVREPASRFRSQHVWLSQFDRSISSACSTESLSAAVDTKLKRLEKRPYMDDCHLVPQAAYYNSGLGCQHVIKHEHFKEEFPRLLRRFGIEVDLSEPAQPKIAEGMSTNCFANFSRKAMEKLHEYYSKDYLIFGYPKVLPAK